MERNFKQELYKEIGKLKIENEFLKKIQSNIPDRSQIIEKDNKDISIRRQCEILSVNRSSLYYKEKSKPEDFQLEDIIETTWHKRPMYGYRKIYHELKRKKHEVSEYKVRKIMNKRRICSIPCKKNLSVPNKEHKIYPYLL